MYEYENSMAEAAHTWMSARAMEMGIPQFSAVTTKLVASLGASVQSLAPQSMTDAEVYHTLWEAAPKHLDPTMLRSMLAKPPENVLLLSAFRWVGCGLPVVTMGHKYAAALLATAVPEDVYQYVIPPWKAFIIQVPDNLLYCDSGHNGRLSQVRAILVNRLDGSAANKWTYVAMTENVLLWRFSPDLKDLLLERLTTNIYEDLSFMLDMQDVDGRVAAMIGRLIVNSCLAMSDPSNIKAPSRQARAKAAHKLKTRGEPVVSTYVLGKPITIDCRQAVAAYCRGERQPPSVQVLVRGHWKMQPCGPARAQRKLIHVEPYWRGPEDAPINVKAIQLGKDIG